MGSRAYDHALYVGSDMLLRLLGLRDAVGVYQDGATVQATVMDADGTEVSGQTWPVTMSSIRNSAGITALDSGDNSVTVGGDHTDQVLPGDRVEITGSTGNNGVYHVEDERGAVSLTDAGDTVVVLRESLPDSTADGSLGWGHGSYHATLKDDVDLSAGTVYTIEIDADAGNDVVSTFRMRALAQWHYL
jgi:hypothetical protein